MKKLLIVLLVLALTASTTAYALTSTQTCTMTLTVLPVFELTVGNQGIAFDPIDENTTTPVQNLDINTISNTGESWRLLFSSTPMENLTSDVIPDSNCYVAFTTGGAGTSPYETTGSFPGSTPAVLYNSAVGEIGNFTHTAVLSVYVPPVQAGGPYKSIITFTMVEM